MKSVADFKTEIRTRKGLKNDPVGTFSTMFSVDKQFNGLFQKAVETILPDILKEISQQMAERIIQDTSFRLLIINSIFAHVRQPKDGVTPEKGKDYDDGKDGHTPIKGKDYFTPNEIKAIENSVASKIKHGKDGHTPIKFIDYFTAQEQQEIVANAVEKAKMGGKDIVDSINSLPIEPDMQIDAKHIKNLPKIDKREGTTIARGGIKLIWDTALEGTIDGNNTIFTVPSSLPSPKDNKYIVSARGTLKTVDGGDFTVSNSNRTITFTAAPPSGSARPRINLYHAS